ncbi:RNA 3'-terminal phosphate cyclase [Thermodesulfobacterium hydrogeniphilum]|uniref:RNA 3'-terminal phosphate cyclase n=1 Tax=Thermodesulfobacterium hydrogeniphilum TaxID=161156 RepID=UPI00056F25E9|nr:RNA 3'-terminal phosphate cyclase [Thermodesulfobacterium hydrogeniphilum]
MLLIDGSYGEGGGQILRTSLSLAIIFKKPVKIFNIRVNRSKPGLQPQHLACVKASAEISKAEVQGAELNSKEIIFIPKDMPSNKTYIFDIKTAGSTGLLFQTLIYPLAFSEGGTLIIKGGTHIPYSPCYHYLKYVFLPVVENFGLKSHIIMEKAGFYPKGGGKIKAKIFPWKEFYFPNLASSFVPFRTQIISLISDKLPSHILERQAKSALEILKSKVLEAEIILEKVKTESPGTMLFIYSIDKDRIKRAGFTELGRKRYPAEEVGKNAAFQFLNFLDTHTQIEEHLGDQLLIPISLAILNSKKKEFGYTVSKVTRHLLTQAWLIPQFIPEVKIEIKGKEGEKGDVRIEER